MHAQFGSTFPTCSRKTDTKPSITSFCLASKSNGFPKVVLSKLFKLQIPFTKLNTGVHQVQSWIFLLVWNHFHQGSKLETGFHTGPELKLSALDVRRICVLLFYFILFFQQTKKLGKRNRPKQFRVSKQFGVSMAMLMTFRQDERALICVHVCQQLASQEPSFFQNQVPHPPFSGKWPISGHNTASHCVKKSSGMMLLTSITRHINNCTDE